MSSSSSAVGGAAAIAAPEASSAPSLPHPVLDSSSTAGGVSSGAGASPSSTCTTSTSSLPILAIIWDLDGTLVDTESLSTQAINMVLEPFGKFCDEPLKREITGTRRDWWTSMMVPRLGLEGLLTPQQLGDGWEANCNTLMPQAALMPGVDSITASLEAAGIMQGVATSSTRPHAKLNAPHPHVAARMRVIITGDMVKNGKPAPDIFLLAAERLGVHPSQCLVVEDSPLGVAGARSAGMVVVAVPDPVIQIPTHHFAEAGADLILKTLEGVTVEQLISTPRKA